MTYELSTLQQFEDQVTAIKMSELSDQDKQIIYDLASRLDIEQRSSISEYGTDVLRDISNISAQYLSRTKNNQLSKDIADTLTTAMTAMRKAGQENVPERGGIAGLIDKWKNRASDKMFELQLDMQDINQSLNVMEGKLHVYIDDLEKDAQVLETLKNSNREHYNRLTAYIAAAELKLFEYENVILPDIKSKAETSGDMMQLQDYNELVSKKTQLERHIHNLKAARQMTLQQMPQIIALQEADMEQKQQLQDHILLSVPLWRNQLGLTTMLHTQAEISGVSKASYDFTNQLMMQNAKLLNQTISDIAVQNERGIIDAESFQVVAGEIEGMIVNVMNAQEDGRRKRKDAERIFEESDRRVRDAVLVASNKSLQLEAGQDSTKRFHGSAVLTPNSFLNGGK